MLTNWFHGLSLLPQSTTVLILLTFYELPSYVSESSTDCSHSVFLMFIPDKNITIPLTHVI